MYEIKKLDDVYANQVVIYTIKNLLATKSFPHFALFTGTMGVGKTSVAKVVANELNMVSTPVHTFNMGAEVDLAEVERVVFSMNPVLPTAFIFEELHGLSKDKQTALLNLMDRRPENVYIIATTTEEDNILRTLRSRATVWHFKALSTKQMGLLLDDYLVQKEKTMEPALKKALVQASRGIPRDMLKSVDLALAGNFDAATMNDLLGNVSDDLAFSLFVSLKSSPVDFAMLVNDLLEEQDNLKVAKLKDFWARYFIESASNGGAAVLGSEVVQTLDNLYNEKEKQLVTKTLIGTKANTLALNLILLNSQLNSIAHSNQKQVGLQKEKRAEAEHDRLLEKRENQTIGESAKLSSSILNDFKLQ